MKQGIQHGSWGRTDVPSTKLPGDIICLKDTLLILLVLYLVTVTSGVFLPNITVDYEGAKTACALQYSRLASLDQVTNAFKNGYEVCKWGWIEEHKIVMLRLTPFLPCSNYNVGILIRDCPNIYSAFCVDDTGLVRYSAIDRTLVPSFENASLTCANSGWSVANKTQIKANISVLPADSSAWYNWGVGQIQNGSFVPDVCYDTLSHASAFCYNPDLADTYSGSDSETIKKIIVGSLLALVFVVLLAAAACMRGNRFVCCMEKRQNQPPGAITAPVPTWNTTSTYRRISQANKGVLYDNIIRDKRPPIIRPEMSHYKTHYSNFGFDTTGEE
ncbi:LOW QUALITY PROTEIN: uncharacterized protein PAF06_015348 [Gastrophryne carolinensis]